MATASKTAAVDATRVKINISLGNDNEPRDVFLGGMEEGDMRITRGKDVLVPLSVLERLDHAVLGVAETDAEDPSKVTMVDRLRFPYTVVSGAPGR